MLPLIEHKDTNQMKKDYQSPEPQNVVPPMRFLVQRNRQYGADIEQSSLGMPGRLRAFQYLTARFARGRQWALILNLYSSEVHTSAVGLSTRFV